MDVESGLDAAQAQWLQANILQAALPEGTPWFYGEAVSGDTAA